MLAGRPPGEARVMHLCKAQYGLKQPPHAWHHTLHSKLKELGFKASLADPALYILEGAHMCVDDMLIASTRKARVASCKKELMATFKGSDLGPASRVS